MVHLMSVSVELRPRFVRRARQLAKERNRSFQESQTFDNDTDTWGVDPEERNFRGLMGELAFAKYAGLQIDPSVHRRTDGGHDFEVILNGQRTTVDIKTASKEPKALMVKEDAVNADYYVLGHLNGQTVTFYGGATRTSVRNGLPKESPYGHTNLTLGIDYLEPLPDPEEIKPVG